MQHVRNTRFVMLVLLFTASTLGCSRVKQYSSKDDEEKDGAVADVSSGEKGGAPGVAGNEEIDGRGRTITENDYDYAGTQVPGTGGAWSGSAAIGGSIGLNAYCDEEGYCYYENYFCDPWGNCCSDETGECWYNGYAPVGGAAAPSVVGGIGGGFIDPIDPADYTDNPWDPPLENLSNPGWHDSEKPLCTEIQSNIYSFSTWSDSRGVFVLVSGQKDDNDFGMDGTAGTGPVPPFDPVGFPLGCDRDTCFSPTIYFNDGDGWTTYYQEKDIGYLEKQLTGFEGGPLVTYGWEESYYYSDDPNIEYTECGLAMISDSSKKCEPVYSAESAFVVNDTLAYGVFDGTMFYFDGENWGPLPFISPTNGIRNIWASETHLFATIEGNGMIHMLNEGVWQIQDTHTLQRFTTIWGFDDNDVWAGTNIGGLFHYDGAKWEEVSWDKKECPWDSGIIGMWGADGILYFYTDTEIARVQDSSVEVVSSWDCPMDSNPPRIRSIWGNSADEVFFTVIDDSFPRRECGIAYILYYDGKNFHQF